MIIMGESICQIWVKTSTSMYLKQAVTDPEVAARKKIKKQLAKKEAKKRRLVELKPSKKAKKQRYQEFTVAD